MGEIFFNPSQGNLLLDIRNFMPEVERLPPFDLWRAQRSQTVFGDPISSVYAADVNATAGTVDTMGLVTLFVVQVPEPSTWWLGCIAMALVAFARQ